MESRYEAAKRRREAHARSTADFERADRRRRLEEIREFERDQRRRWYEREWDFCARAAEAGVHFEPRPYPKPATPKSTTAQPSSRPARWSNSAPWAVRVLYDGGSFEWVRVANEREGRDVARRLTGPGRQVDLLQMGQSRMRTTSQDSGGLIR